MSRGGLHGQLVIAVLSEALKHFGAITRENQADVTWWVRSRVAELERESREPETTSVESRPRPTLHTFNPLSRLAREVRDGKAAASGDDE